MQFVMPVTHICALRVTIGQILRISACMHTLYTHETELVFGVLLRQLILHPRRYYRGFFLFLFTKIKNKFFLDTG